MSIKKNINFNASNNEKFILVVDALSTTPFANIHKNLSIDGLFTDEISKDESILIEKSIQKFEKYLKKISNKIVNSLFVYFIDEIAMRHHLKRSK